VIRLQFVQEITPVLGWGAVPVQFFLLTLVAAVFSYIVSAWSDPGFYVAKSGAPTSPEADGLRMKYNEVRRQRPCGPLGNANSFVLARVA
jgi:hypothetical protein